MSLSRRRFMQYAGMAAGSSLLPLAPLNQAMASTINGKTLVVLYLRFGADGLDMIPPVGINVPQSQIDAYHALRTLDTEKLYVDPSNSSYTTLELDGYFEMHSAFEYGLKDAWDDNNLAIIHAVGGAGSRSHFVAQDHTEWSKEVDGAGNQKGWLHEAYGRLLSEQAGGISPPISQQLAGGISIGTGIDKSLAGGDYANEIISVNGISNNILNPLGEERDLLRDMYTSVASHMGLVDSTTASINTLDAIETLPPNTNPNYQTDNLSSHLNDIARIIKSNTAPPFMTVNFTSWDYHANLRSRMDAKIQDLNDALGVFYHDLKDSGKLDSTCVLVMSEFGRTLDRNKDVGLDHGNGSVMFVMGGGISAGKGGQVVADWPGLPIPDYVTEPGKTKAIVDPAYPNAVEYTSSSESRLQLRATTHYTQVYRDILEDFHGITNANDVFGYDPGYSKLNLFSS